MKIRELLASTKTYSKGRAGKAIRWIVVHYTGAKGTARQNCVYFSGGNRQASAHYFIDGSGVIWRSVREEDTAWAVGNFDMNQRSISIEVASDGEDFSNDEIAELKELVVYLMDKYGIDTDHVIRHYDVAKYASVGKTIDPYKHCPAPYLDNSKWQALKARITSRDNNQVPIDGVITYDDVIALEKIFDIYENGVIFQQPYGWKPRHKAIRAITYANDPQGSDVVRNMQRLCGLTQNGYLGKVTITAWQEFIGVTADGYFGEDTARATERWINKLLKKYKITL